MFTYPYRYNNIYTYGYENNALVRENAVRILLLSLLFVIFDSQPARWFRILLIGARTRKTGTTIKMSVSPGPVFFLSPPPRTRTVFIYKERAKRAVASASPRYTDVASYTIRYYDIYYCARLSPSFIRASSLAGGGEARRGRSRNAVVVTIRYLIIILVVIRF